MKGVKIIVAVALGFAVGGVVPRSTLSPNSKKETLELETLRNSLAEAKQAAEKAASARDRMKDEADRLRAAAEEVHRLRAEVSRLKTELAESQKTQQPWARAAQKAPVIPEGAVRAKESGERPPIAIESAPVAVQMALYRELGGRPASGVLIAVPDKTGRTYFGFKGQTADQRSVALRLGEDGSVIERSLEVAADALPPHIQAPAAEVFGNLPIGAAREIVEGENVIYELSAKGPDSRIQATVRHDGTVLAYSAKRQIEREQPKEKR